MDRQVTVMVDGERTFALPVPESLVAGFLDTVRDDAREHRNLAVVYVDTDPDTGDAEKVFDFRSGRHAEPSRPRPRLQRVLDYIERMLR